MLLQRLDRQWESPDDGYPLGFSDLSDHHQARMQTQTRCQRLFRRVAERRQPLVQPPRGQHSSPGVIFLGHRGAK